MKNAFLYLKITVLFGMLVLTGCLHKKERIQDNFWAQEIINQTICRLPCWNGIVPGQTTMNEVDEILVNGLIKAKKTDELDFSDTKGTIFVFGPNEIDNCQITIESTGGELNKVIRMTFDTRERYLLTLGEIINKIGTPDYVTYDEHGFESSLILLFNDENLEVQLDSQYIINNQAKKNTKVVSLSIYSNDYYEDKLKQLDNFLYKWHDYGKYQCCDAY